MESTDTIPQTEMKNEIDWSGKTILVADDVYTNFLLIEAILKGTNANVIWAKNGQEAINQCVDHDHIDMILMDIQMPVMNGIEATREIKRLRTDLPVIAQTAFTMDFDEKTLLMAGCSQVLTKPLIPDLFIKTLKKYF